MLLFVSGMFLVEAVHHIHRHPLRPSSVFFPLAQTRMLRFTIPSLAKKLVPLCERVLVKRTAAAKTTKAGIMIPEQVAGKVNEGTVIAVAAGSKDWTPTVKPNDTVLLPEFGGNAIKLDGEEFHLFDESQILGVVTSA